MTPDYCRNLCLIRLISCNRGVRVLSRRPRAHAPHRVALSRGTNAEEILSVVSKRKIQFVILFYYFYQRLAFNWDASARASCLFCASEVCFSRKTLRARLLIYSPWR